MRDAQRYDLDPDPRVPVMVKVTGNRKLQNHPNSKSIYFAKIRSIYRLMVDYYTTGQYLKFEIRPSFLSRDFELGRKIDRDL